MFQKHYLSSFDGFRNYNVLPWEIKNTQNSLTFIKRLSVVKIKIYIVSRYWVESIFKHKCFPKNIKQLKGKIFFMFTYNRVALKHLCEEFEIWYIILRKAQI